MFCIFAVNIKSPNMSNEKKVPEPNGKFKVFVGIDFGTDGSALAYSFENNDGSCSSYIHNMWDVTKATKKSETSVLFDDQNQMLRVGTGAKNMYFLYEEDKGLKFFQRFKMKLYEEPAELSIREINDIKDNNDTPISNAISTANDADAKESTEKVFIEQLKYLKKQSFNFISTHLTKTIQLKGDASTGWPEIQYFLTVPAIWSDKAKAQMTDFAIKAGFIDGTIPNQLQIVYEPDCASLSIQYAIKRNMRKSNQNVKNINKGLESLQPQVTIDVSLKRGDKYILLDVGAGTCDVACHEMTGDFAIGEVFHPSGGRWGSCCIDQQFVKLLNILFPNNLLQTIQANTVGKKCYLKLLNNFAKAKVSYCKNNKILKHHNLQIPIEFVIFLVQNLQDNGLTFEDIDIEDADQHLVDLNKMLKEKYESLEKMKNFKHEQNANPDNWMIKIIKSEEDTQRKYLLSMHNNVWQCLFDYTIDPIITHCRNILLTNEMKNCKFIFLVGGFANSKYFQVRMQKSFADHNNLSVVIPHLPGLCVVDGASRYGLNKYFVKIRQYAKRGPLILRKCLVLSICIQDYLGKATTRIGCDIDIQHITSLFGETGYDYDIIQNTTKAVDLCKFEQLKIQAKSKLLTNAANYDGFIFIFSGHGVSSTEIALSPENNFANCHYLRIKEDICDAFRNGPGGLAHAFIGKPRIYIIQACRGKREARVVESKAEKDTFDNNQDNRYHVDEDMLLLKSNTAGYVSYRSHDTGSHLITAVYRCLKEKKSVVLDDALYEIQHQLKQLSQSEQTCVIERTTMNKICL
eukprot:217640_1